MKLFDCHLHSSLSFDSDEPMENYVKQAVADKTAKMVFVTGDTSEKTLKRVQQFCQGIMEVNVTSLTQFEVSQITNKLTGVFAVVDENIAVLCRNAISSEKGE